MQRHILNALGNPTVKSLQLLGDQDPGGWVWLNQQPSLSTYPHCGSDAMTIPLLTRYFVQKHAQRMGRNIDNISTAALEARTRYDWPGNIRELQNVIERSVILTNGNTSNVEMPEFTTKAGSAPLASRMSAVSEDLERQRIIKSA